MREYIRKIKYIMPTYLLVFLFTVLAVLIIQWLLINPFSSLQIPQAIVTIWIPILFPWIPGYIFLYPKIRNFRFPIGKNGLDFSYRDRSFIFFIALVPIILTSFYFQDFSRILSTNTEIYLSTATVDFARASVLCLTAGAVFLILLIPTKLRKAQELNSRDSQSKKSKNK